MEDSATGQSRRVLNPADLMTQYLPEDTIRTYAVMLDLEFATGRAVAAAHLHAVGPATKSHVRWQLGCSREGRSLEKPSYNMETLLDYPFQGCRGPAKDVKLGKRKVTMGYIKNVKRLHLKTAGL